MNKQQLLDVLLSYKQCFYSEDSADFIYWADYFKTLDKQGLLEECIDHKIVL